MFGCHDGIPRLYLKGLIPEERIQQIIRQTFYRNFMDKFDLINWYFD